MLTFPTTLPSWMKQSLNGGKQSMGFLDRFRKKGRMVGSVNILDLPAHKSFIASLAFTKVPAKNSPFPADDPGAPFHKCDYFVPIKNANDPEVLPLTFKVEQPIGFYYLLLRVMMAREIRGKLSYQIENFNLSATPVELVYDRTLTINGSVRWPSIADDDLHEYGRIEDLMNGNV